MCDYSLHSVESRPAKVGDKLVSTKFPNSGTRGFCAVDEPGVAVCLRPGTELAFEKEVQSYKILKGTPNGRHRYTMARFMQVGLENPSQHHDTLEFPDGGTVLVTRLVEGQKAVVLQMPIIGKPENKNRTAVTPGGGTGTITAREMAETHV